MEIDREEYENWISENLEKLDFVDWDRLIEFDTDEVGMLTRVFGWIDRPDEHEDFVHLEFHSDPQNIMFLGTSSKRYSQQIHDRLFGEDGEHNSCKRVENELDVENCIRIETESPGTTNKGGE